MASCTQRRIATFLADGAIPYGAAVKLGSDNKHVTPCSANTDAVIGICQTQSVTTLADAVEVALVGGGAKALAGETISKGKFLVPGAGGALFQTNTSGDHVIGQAMQDAVVNDVFAIEVAQMFALGADA